jgi:DNA-binding response OmpR family regulator
VVVHGEKQVIDAAGLKACSDVAEEYLHFRMQSATPFATILLVEDSPQLVAFLQRMLSEEGYDVREARDGETGLSSALENEPDLVILDVGLPKRNGFEVVRELRRQGIHAPTLMLSARAEVADRVHGLESGADDYLTKPFEADELVARVRALLRRASHHATRLYVGDVILDSITRRVYRGNRELVLTQREFALLEYFMRNVGLPLSRALIAEQVWRQTPVDGGETNIVDVYVAYLRKKLDTTDEAPMLQTVRGIGYVLRPASPRTN